MQGWRNTMEDSHIAKILDETPGNLAVSGLSVAALSSSNVDDVGCMSAGASAACVMAPRDAASVS